MSEATVATGNDFLSEDEVESLLSGVDTVPEETDAQAPGVRPFDLAAQAHPVRARMPALDTINDRFARLLRLALFNFMHRSPEISVAPARPIKHAEFLRDLATPANLNVVQAKALQCQALVVLEPTLVFLIVDALFGGDGRFRTRVEPREFTQTELRIIRRLLQVIVDEYQKAWQPVFALAFEYVRSEMHAQFAHIAPADALLVVSTFSIEFGAGGGALHVAIPRRALEPIREALGSTEPSEPTGGDTRWAQTLAQQVQSAEVTLVATLATAEVKLRDLIALQTGDVLAIDIAPVIEASVDGVPILDCSYGVRNGQYALRIERVRAKKA